jgi:hypothetical protein
LLREGGGTPPSAAKRRRLSTARHSAFDAGGASELATRRAPKLKTQEQSHSRRIEIREIDQTKPNHPVISRRLFYLLHFGATRPTGKRGANSARAAAPPAWNAARHRRVFVVRLAKDRVRNETTSPQIAGTNPLWHDFGSPKRRNKAKLSRKSLHFHRIEGSRRTPPGSHVGRNPGATGCAGHHLSYAREEKLEASPRTFQAKRRAKAPSMVDQKCGNKPIAEHHLLR